MKVNYKKLGFDVLCGISIALTVILFCISLLTKYTVLQYVSCFMIYFQAYYVVIMRKKYNLYIKIK